MNKTIFKTYLIYFIALVLFVGVRIASSFGAFNFISNDILRSDVATIIIQIVIMVLVPLLLCFLLLKKKPKEQFKSYKFNKISFKAILISIGIGAILFFINLIVANFFSSIIHAFGYSNSGSTTTSAEGNPIVLFLLDVLFVAILPGFCEEFLHRGVLMRGVGDQTNYKFAIIISSICFGLMHLNIEQVFYATILGMVIGFVGALSDNIIPCMILHFMNNFLSVYFSYASSQNWIGGNLFGYINSIYANNSAMFAFLFTAIVFALLIAGLIFLIYQLFKETRLKKIQQSLINVQKEISGDLENQTPEKLSTDFKDYILPHLKNSEDVLQIVLPPKAKDCPKQTFASTIFLCATIFMGVLITIFTFIWGVI